MIIFRSGVEKLYLPICCFFYRIATGHDPANSTNISHLLITLQFRVLLLVLDFFFLCNNSSSLPRNEMKKKLTHREKNINKVKKKEIHARTSMNYGEKESTYVFSLDFSFSFSFSLPFRFSELHWSGCFYSLRLISFLLPRSRHHSHSSCLLIFPMYTCTILCNTKLFHYNEYTSCHHVYANHSNRAVDE